MVLVASEMGHESSTDIRTVNVSCARNVGIM